jgi:hypothetical protein
MTESVYTLPIRPPCSCSLLDTKSSWICIVHSRHLRHCVLRRGGRAAGTALRAAACLSALLARLLGRAGAAARMTARATARLARGLLRMPLGPLGSSSLSFASSCSES